MRTISRLFGALEGNPSQVEEHWKSQRLPAATLVLAFAMSATAKEFRKHWRPRLRRLGVKCLGAVHVLADGASWIGKAMTSATARH